MRNTDHKTTQKPASTAPAPTPTTAGAPAPTPTPTTAGAPAPTTAGAPAAAPEPAAALTPLLGMTLDQLTSVALQCGLKAFNGRQMARWLYSARVTDIDQMTDLSLKARASLKQRYTVGRQQPLQALESTDGTVKYLFPGQGGTDVEAVYIPSDRRATLCVSSQAGCRMNCAFCHTGRQGFHGNLTAAQIINQVLAVRNSQDLTNLVFMGMGEPTDNLGPVLQAIDVLTAPWGLGWSPRRITLSTIGNITALQTILDKTQVHIALSAHSPYGPERQALMPVQRRWPLEAVLSHLRTYPWGGQRRLSLEYILFEGLNDTPEHARALARLLQGIPARVNIIRFHPIPGAQFHSPSHEKTEAFRDRLNRHGITATVRASRGQDIMAACGQLAGKHKEQHPRAAHPAAKTPHNT